MKIQMQCFCFFLHTLKTLYEPCAHPCPMRNCPLRTEIERSHLGMLPMPKKTRENVGIFPKSGTPPPSPQFRNPMFLRENKLWFILHFRTLGTFLVFTKMFTFWVVLWLEEVGMGDPPPLREKFPFSLNFLQNEHSGTKNKINLK